MSQQRVNFDIRAEAQSGLVDWWADRLDSSYINQLSGNQSSEDRTDLTVANAAITGLNSIEKIYVPAGQTGAGAGSTTVPSVETRGVLPIAVGTAASLTGSALTDWFNWEAALAVTHYKQADTKPEYESGYFKLSMLDAAVVKARTLKTPIRPIKLNGMECYVAILHPYQVLDLRRNVNNGQWMDIQKSAMMGGQITNNPIFTGAVGMYNGVIIHEDARIPRIGADNKTSLGTTLGLPTVNTAAEVNKGTKLTNFENITRGIFLGAQSGCIAFGRSYGLSGSNVKFKWTEVLNDYENQLGVSAALVYGCKKSVFDGKDFGTIALSSISTGDANTIG
jgi:N4-gp56 family major capsid protein